MTIKNLYTPYSFTYGNGANSSTSGMGMQFGGAAGSGFAPPITGAPALGATGLDTYSPHYNPNTQSYAPVPGAGQINGGQQAPWQSLELGKNLGTAQLAFSGLSSLGNMYAAFNTNKLANKQFEFQKGVTETNLANSIQSYNTKLTDRAAARAIMTGQSVADRDAYVEKNKAVRR